MPDDTRPTFGQALAAADSSSAGSSTSDSGAAATATTGATDGSSPSLGTTPSAPSTDLAPLAAAATQPGTSDGTAPTSPVEEQPWDEAQGPIPVARHKAILEHNRTKAREEAKAALQQEYGWAISMGPQQFQTVSNFARQAASDPVAFALGILDELTASPQYNTQLRSHVAKILATRQNGGGGNGHAAQPQAPVADEPEPQPDMVVDGYSWYSAQKQAERDRWLSNKLLSQVKGMVAPLQEERDARAAHEQQMAVVHAANQFATDTLTEMGKLPHFKEQKAEIERVFRAMPPMADNQVGQAIRDAYIQVLVTKVLPSLNSTAKSELLSNLNQKAAASARNPASGAVAVAGRPKTFKEALQQRSVASR